MPIENFLAYYCGPALAGIKTANIASYNTKNNPNAKSYILGLNKKLNKKGIYIELLYECENRVLVMVYRRNRLCDYLNNESIKKLLQSYGYPKNFSLDLYLDFLKKRINEQYADGKDFPHEIGAFLGYPIHDIYGFIYHKNEGCLLTGEWKVYAQAEQAEKIFCRYQLCRKAILKRVNEGKTLEQLFCRV